MAVDLLLELLQPYQRAMTGAEINMKADPVYSTLLPETATAGTFHAPGAMQGARSLQQIADRFGWDEGKQWQALLDLMARESGGNRFAQNPDSTAYGRWQFLDSTWDDVGGHKTSNRRLQDIYGLRYINQRYGSPLDALAFHNREGFY